MILCYWMQHYDGFLLTFINVNHGEYYLAWVAQLVLEVYSNHYDINPQRFLWIGNVEEAKLYVENYLKGTCIRIVSEKELNLL